jgi:hypothetical protein
MDVNCMYLTCTNENMSKPTKDLWKPELWILWLLEEFWDIFALKNMFS